MAKKVLYFISSQDITGVETAMEHSIEDEVTILLLQNAVYFANKFNNTVSQAINQNKIVIACKEDIMKRGLVKFISDKIKLVTTDEVVDLIFENDSILNF
ncbi:DsrH/TusB family sulfur metabolism protein [Promethearchaeum syntrophicum]|uniref:DsrH/TusB family sulfur metabolism protein n=1 Tax=Promethearchaeum syntrophicum TaxID=2594042 RepID=A0A5B9DHL1_9ARCH|nr:DsrH/TusB family sulfur metabolism protein [Candidatus Prometheoarchaeum syntrophicum]QEE18117.1 Protein TusB [Candidatus Prometheoarchaeum syntrophicum]